VIDPIADPERLKEGSSVESHHIVVHVLLWLVSFVG
jgi:hypothetical protein